jgi:hypothetical protein
MPEQGCKVVGALLPAEQAVIDERNRLAKRYQACTDREERRRLLEQIDAVVKRYDEMRRGRWERGEVR